MNLNEFSKVCNTLSKKFVGFKETQKELSEKFTQTMADVGVNYFKEKVKTGGEGLTNKGGYGSHPVTGAWKDTKQKYTGQSKDAIATGASLEHLKVLKRTKGVIVIGLEEDTKVKHFGWGGDSKSGRTIKIGDYIKYISRANKPRPLIIQAVASFNYRIFPKGVKVLQECIENNLQKKFGPTSIKETIYKNTIKSDVDKTIKKVIQKVEKLK